MSFMRSSQAGEYYIENVLRGKGSEKKSNKLAAQEMASGDLETNISS